MATNKRSIGDRGLEQGGPNLGNSYERDNTTPAGGSEIIPAHDEDPEDLETNNDDNEEEEDDED